MPLTLVQVEWGKPAGMVALDVSAYVCVAIVVGSFAFSVCEGGNVSLCTFVDYS